ncbi:MAG: proteasome assembly chaperone family protein [Candidatus Baldrarchaeia archaeon]
MSVEEEVIIREIEEISVKNPKVLIGLPEVGLVGIISAIHLIETLSMKEVGYLKSHYFPPLVILHKGKVKAPMRIYNYEDILLIISEIPIPPAVIPQMARKIVNWSKDKGTEIIVMLGGLPVPNRIDIESPKVYAIPQGVRAEEITESLGIERLREGIMVGPYASILLECCEQEQDALLLSAEAYMQYPDPGAAASILQIVAKVLNVELDVKPLLEKAEDLRIRLRDLMRRTTQTMQRMGKMQEHGIPPMMYI